MGGLVGGWVGLAGWVGRGPVGGWVGGLARWVGHPGGWRRSHSKVWTDTHMNATGF